MNFILASHPALAPLSLDVTGLSAASLPSGSVWGTSFCLSLPQPPLASSSTHSPTQCGPEGCLSLDGPSPGWPCPSCPPQSSPGGLLNPATGLPALDVWPSLTLTADSMLWVRQTPV